MDAVTAQAPRWRRRAEARPDEILDAALAEFSENGFDAAKLEAIAERAGLSKGALYLYFDGKEAILKALIERHVAPVADAMRARAFEGLGDPAATLVAIVAGMIAAGRRPEIAAAPKIVLSVAPRFPGVAAYYREHVIEKAVAAMAALHRAGVATGVFRDADSELVARFVLGPFMMQVLFVHVFSGDEYDKSPDDVAAELTGLMLAGLGAGGGR